jgi:hypothetical protein
VGLGTLGKEVARVPASPWAGEKPLWSETPLQRLNSPEAGQWAVLNLDLDKDFPALLLCRAQLEPFLFSLL